MAKKTNEELQQVFRQCRSYFVTAAIFSLAINVLYLASPIYMLQVYDRVISSTSEVTLVMLTIALLIAFLSLSGLDAVRSRILARASIRLDQLMASRVITSTLKQAGNGTARSQPLRDFDTFRQTFTGNGIHALFDLPWAPIYIAVIFVLHSWLGLFALAAAVLLVTMALANEWIVRRPLEEANETATRNYSFTEMSLRNADVIHAMGMVDGLVRRWSRDRNRVLERQTVASDRAAAMSSMIRFTRLAMQSIILGLGAYLVIERQSTVGTMFAASILLGRALQPVEQMVASWRALVSGRGAYLRVKQLLVANPPHARSLVLPRPAGRLSVEGLQYGVPGLAKPILKGISFRIEAGEALGIIGPSGAGKSTLARQIVGVLRPSSGAVRLDGADVSAWQHQSLGRHLGYLPQDVELFADTVAANISRFQPNADAEIVQAARLAGVHEMIMRLANGYETDVGEGGAVLSGGYRQRVGLARAVFGEPALVVFDEPSSSLDADGEAALADCVLELKKRGTTIIIISHRSAALMNVDKILVLRDGAIEMFGDRSEIIPRLTRPVRSQPAPAGGRDAAVAARGG